jgi:uncharacterized protein (TIGR02246 family)
MNSLWLRAGLVLCLSLALPLQAAAQSDDVRAIRELQTRQANAWNKHDAKAYSNLFADDGDVVNVLGWWWKGREQIRSKLSDAFQFVFRESVLTITDVHVRVLDPTVAVAHVSWTMEGAKVPPGAPAPPNRGIQLQVLQKHLDRWVIISFQNTNSVPETPFPKAPPGSNP